MLSYKKLVVLFCGLMLSLAGLAAAQEGASAPQKKIVLKYANAEGAEQIKIAKEICAAFEKDNPDIRIEMDFMTHIGTITERIAAGQPPDVFMWWGGLTEMQEKGDLLPLGQHVKKNNVNMKKYYKELVDFYSYGSELYGMPLQMNTQCIVYNKDMFDKEKLPYPQPGWTWQDYYFTAKKLTKDMNKDGIREQFGSSKIDTRFFLVSNGSKIIDFEKKKCVVDTADNRIMIEYLQKLRRDCCPTKTESAALVAGLTGVKQDFYTGKVAMGHASAWNLTDYSTIKNFKWDVVPLPVPITGNNRAIFDEACLVISKKTQYPDEAFRFVNFYCGEKGMKIFAAGKDGIPADINIARKEFLKGLPASAKYYLDAADVAKVPMNEREPKLNQAMLIFSKYFDQFYFENRGMDEILKNITWDTDELLKQ
ncbi:MAG: hypothetical protein A2297_04870 [Elusimicrobia bacterium RIFOXYB2_FULL_48_7]|nr:MAG: hypothetical protein A2297_04870 [Elusimicrobia bacterium RIFOXYB2_FULL_48_7]